jgi:hypothetical protein
MSKCQTEAYVNKVLQVFAGVEARVDTSADSVDKNLRANALILELLEVD